MREKDLVVCNVCGLKSSDDKNAVFIHAHKNGEEVDICTSLYPKRDTWLRHGRKIKRRDKG